MRRGIAALSCVALMTTAAVACESDEKPDAKTRVERALKKLGEQKSVTMTVGFDATQDQVWSVMKDEEGFTRELAKTLADLDVSVSTSSDEPVADAPADAASAFRFSVGEGKDLLESRTVDGKTYVRAEVEDLLTLASDAGAGEELGSMREMLGAADELPSSYRSVKDLFGGKWVSLDLDAYKEFSDSMGEDAPDMPMLEPVSPDTRKEITDALHKAVTQNAKFADAGTRDGAEHVEVTVPAGKVADTLATGLKPLEKQLPDDLRLSELNKAQDRDLVLDVAIKDGVLSQVTVDVAKLEKGTGGELPLTVGFTTGAAPVKAPADVVALNPQDLMGAVMRMMMGELGGPAGTEKG